MIRPAPELGPALGAIATAINSRFDRLLAVPEGPRSALIEAMRHATMNGGKRMRPLLVVCACDLFGVDKDRALRVALAIEAVHCYSLVHDDLPCMDDDDLRRGQPTVHKLFGEATALLAGDALQTLAFELLADEQTHEDPRVRIELVLELAKAAGARGMVGGQVMDLAAERQPFDLPETTRMQQLKTGALISFSVEAGAIMGRANPDHRRMLRGYAHDLGLVFQIADDLIDAEGDSAAAGKRVGKDAAAGKATFVSLLGVERAREQARILTDQAIQHLQGFGPEADLLRAIAQFTIDRNH